MALQGPAPETSSATQTRQKVRVEASKSDEKRPSAEPVVEATLSKKMKPVIPMLVVISVFVAGFAIAGARGTSSAVVDGKIARNFGAASPCQSASIPFTANEGVDLTQQGEQLLKGFDKPYILAGGINIENINEALTCNPYAIDIASGIEKQPGEKDPCKMGEIFERIGRRGSL